MTDLTTESCKNSVGCQQYHKTTTKGITYCPFAHDHLYGDNFSDVGLLDFIENCNGSVEVIMRLSGYDFGFSYHRPTSFTQYIECLKEFVKRWDKCELD